MDIEEALPGRLSRRAAARGPGELEIRVIDDRQSPVQAFQGESDRVKGGECRQQRALPRQRRGGPARNRGLFEQGSQLVRVSGITASCRPPASASWAWSIMSMYRLAPRNGSDTHTTPRLTDSVPGPGAGSGRVPPGTVGRGRRFT